MPSPAGCPTHRESGSKPTRVEPHLRRALVYVANTGRDELVKIDLDAPCSLGITPDGRYLVATLKAAAATGIFDVAAGRETGRIANSRDISRGGATAADGAYAFVPVEGVGAQPGQST